MLDYTRFDWNVFFKVIARKKRVQLFVDEVSANVSNIWIQ